MTRAWVWAGAGCLVAGAALAVLLRITLPAAARLQFGFFADPAGAALLAGLALTLLCLAVAAGLRWSSHRTRRALARQAAALETERRRFIQRLDHELKNPLTAIQIQLDNLQAQAGLPAVAEVRAQADRLATLTRGLRRLADLESRPLELEQVEIGELLDEVADLLQQPERIQFDVQRVPWPAPPIQADRELLLMALRNLVDNALKYSPAHAPVQVRVRETAGALVVEVADGGRGIPAEDLPLVTAELYRGSNVRDVAGSGLGLAMVQRIIGRHHGHLDMRSRPGQGTLVTVQLPYEPART